MTPRRDRPDPTYQGPGGATGCSRCGREEQLRRGLCHTCYERDRRAGLINPLVTAGPARSHIVILHIGGWNYREIARAADVDRSVVTWIVRGREKINARTARAITTIDPADHARFVRSGWTQERRATQRWPEWSEERRRETPRKAWITRRENMRRRMRPTYEELRAEWDARDTPVPFLPDPGPWTDEALCAQVDTDIFFPNKGGYTGNAKKVCERCAVRQQCLDYALENDIGFGIFGGLSVKERKRAYGQGQE
jgi:WhiB family transcriptional regulator, redox-sensing transcriptional regulator